VFEPLRQPLWTPFNLAMLALMAWGAISFVARFVLGLGGGTQLSDTYAWGLWIVFDLVWIAIAAGAFATAGLIYVFQRKDLYSMGRAAVLMGLLSYSFVMVTLLADLGQPLHAYQLAIQAPEQSAMFEVSWCVGLYVSVLLIEFLPVPLEYWGWTARWIWKRWQGAYVAFAVTLFVYVLSRNVMSRRAPRSSRRSRGHSGRRAIRSSPSCSPSQPSRSRRCIRARSGRCSCSCAERSRRSGGPPCCQCRSSCPRSPPAPGS
jgi:formate dehydrogenase iron-sulfur subunit